MDQNILHPDVIVDTDNISDCSSIASIKSKRKSSSSTDGESTNYELIEFLKRREKRDEELLRRMDAREERLLALFERTVVAIEALVDQKRSRHTSQRHIMNPLSLSSKVNGLDQDIELEDDTDNDVSQEPESEKENQHLNLNLNQNLSQSLSDKLTKDT